MKNIIVILLGLVLVTNTVALFGLRDSGGDDAGIGAAGGRYLEQYVPVVRYNGGMATQLPFDMDGTSANLAVGGTMAVTGVTTMAADLTVTTTNTATSSVEAGCFDSYATSTETAIRLSATSTIPGDAVWVFGTCSGL